MKEDYIKRKKILLVDDEAELREMVASLLAQDGYTEVRTAGSVEKALDELGGACP